jgi:hypothetical protein
VPEAGVTVSQVSLAVAVQGSVAVSWTVPEPELASTMARWAARVAAGDAVERRERTVRARRRGITHLLIRTIGLFGARGKGQPYPG